MAYDASDPADKKIVADAVKAALEAQATEHEADVEGLKNKNKDLVTKLKKATEGQPDAAEVERLEAQIETNKTELKAATKALKAAEAKLGEVSTELTTERTNASKLLVDTSLTEALGKAKVAPEFMDAVKALLAPQVSVKIDGSEKKIMVGDKLLADHVTEWSQGDQGKVYVQANSNVGLGAPGGKAIGGVAGKTMSRAAFDTLLPSEQKATVTGGTQVVDA